MLTWTVTARTVGEKLPTSTSNCTPRPGDPAARASTRVIARFANASRGATEVRLVEQDPALVAQLKVLQAKLQAHAVQVLRGDGIAALKQLAPASMNLIFLDPPFDAKLYEAALQAAARALASGGYVYLEAPSAWGEEQLAPLGLTLYRHLKAGAVHAHLLTKETS